MVASQGQNGTTTVITGRRQLPLLVFTVAPLIGHVLPLIRLAQDLSAKGYSIIFMSSTEHKERLEKGGFEWYECSDFFPPGTFEARLKMPPTVERTMYDIEHVFLSQIPSRSASLRSLLEMVRERDPERQVIVMAESCSMATAPFIYGAPLPKGYHRMPKIIGISVLPLIVTSCDTAPFGPGLPPDSSESGRARNMLINQMMAMGPMRPLQEAFVLHLTKLGATKVSQEIPFLDQWLTSFDTTFQTCSPSMDYPRSDLPLSIRYCGNFPPGPIDPDYVFPSWWSEIKEQAALPANSPTKKKIVTVCQGTVNMDFTELLIPTIKALSQREDIILVAIIGMKDMTLPEDVKISANTRVVDYLPYDAVLALSDLFVMNGGYGAFTHAVNHGVPVIAAGLTEDKSEVSARIEYAGLGVNLKTQTPSSESITEAAAKILGNPQYKLRAKRLQQDNRDLDAYHMIEKQIREYANEEI
ncbi:glycosyltransferase family 1 protein [Xylariaceae sp. FL0255]|nr:glycosyltransferase family 1 protein [Xylariaceae sp. FL0255]